MTELPPILGEADDPLLPLLSERGAERDAGATLVASQWLALANWSWIAQARGQISILLRRRGAESAAEWDDALGILGEMLDRTTRDVDLVALSTDAAAEMSARLQRGVDALAPLPRCYSGERRLTLDREGAAVQLSHACGGPLSARRYNLSRLRRLAMLDAGPGEADLADIAAFANGDVGVAVPTPDRAPVVIVVVPNGTGLGHVTRMLAVAQRLRQDRGARVIFWCFSQGAGILARFGFETVLRQTARHLGASGDAWLDWEIEEFAAHLSSLQPDLVVQDASIIQDFVVEALARPGTGNARLALIRRGMWQKSVLGAAARSSEDLADLVMEPSDLAAGADRGVTRGRHAQTDCFARMALSAPVTLTRPDDMLSRRQARRALGIGRGPHCLISLGGDETGERHLLMHNLQEAAAKARVRLYVASSPLTTPEPNLIGMTRTQTVHVYPLAPFLAAFDGIVTAAGYNSFHEVLQLSDRPVLFAPGRGARRDDQAARAGFAAEQSWAYCLDDERPIHETVATFMADVRAGASVTSRPAWRDGAGEIANALCALIDCEG
jgi:hypothetical protein